ncbi:hypothetical protein TrRE_jg5577 [Triparma retinervis]|uniref:Uncharacterized protein n=1 Tax=Triparma retinervis TaxID=2557542 RepID=A0A9W6ZHE2_9STRA|nr:hypothetical protein TrRE_jg5577 [Triparma retinervis]
MPPKKSKPRRTPHANETPLKHKAPGHGAVSRAEGNMWSQGGGGGEGGEVKVVGGVDRPKYKAASTSVMSIGRGGGGGGGMKKKKKAGVAEGPTAKAEGTEVPAGAVRSNPDASFFS